MRINNNNSPAPKPTQKPPTRPRPKFKNFSIGTLNCTTLKDEYKLFETADHAASLGLSILAIQEHKIQGSGTIDLKDHIKLNWSFEYSGFTDKSYGGVGLLYDNSVVKIVDSTDPIPGRLQIFKLKLSGFRVILPVIYSPTDTNSTEIKSKFYRELDKYFKEYRDKNPGWKFLAAGDLNATIGRDMNDRGYASLGSNNDQFPTNTNGELAIELAEKQELNFLNSKFRSKYIHLITFACPRYKKRVDYFLADQVMTKFATQCRVFRLSAKGNDRNIEFGTDHRLLVLRLSLPTLNTTQLTRKERPQKSKSPKKVIKVSSLRDDTDLRVKFAEEISSNLAQLPTSTDSNEISENIISALQSAAKKALPTVTQEQNLKTPWSDPHYQKLIDKKKKLKNRPKKEKAKLEKEIKKCRKKLKREFYKAKAKEINYLQEVRDVEHLFAKAKDFNILSNAKKKLEIDPRKLETHFKNHFSKKPFTLPAEITDPESFPHVLDLKSKIKIDEHRPTRQEIIDCCKTFNNNKCRGSDKIFGEYLKYGIGSTEFIDALYELLGLIWDGSTQPEAWKFSTIQCIYKNKGSKQKAEFYRGISISSILGKLTPKIILERLRVSYENLISPNQYGFRKSRSTTDGIFILKNLLEKSEVPMVSTFIDLKAAYDWIDRDGLLRVFEFRTGAPIITKILRESFRETTAQIKGCKTTFNTEAGLKQGALESPVLFNIFFDFCIQIAKYEIKAEIDPAKIEFDYSIDSNCFHLDRSLPPRERPRPYGKLEIDEEEYADDLVTVNTSIEDAENCLKIFDRVFRRFGLTISFGKTETMLFNFDEETTAKKSLFSINDEVIKNVRKFTYLGHKITNTDVADYDTSSLDHRISLAKMKFQELKKVLQDREIDIKTRAATYLQMFVRTRLLYGAQSWNLKEAEIKRIEVVWHGFLRRMVNGGFSRKESSDPTVENFSFKYSNDDLVKMTATSPIRHFIYNQQLKYVAHVCRLPNEDARKKMLFSKGKKYSRSVWTRLAGLTGRDKEQVQKMMMDKKLFQELLFDC